MLNSVSNGVNQKALEDEERRLCNQDTRLAEYFFSQCSTVGKKNLSVTQ